MKGSVITMTKNPEKLRKIIHIDMDAFYAAVEVRDNPDLAGKPLIIGALPHERGVVATCSYEARKFGLRSAMSIKEAYRRCPAGIYMHPNMEKYAEASKEIHRIWAKYTDLIEHISLDEGFLDVTGTEFQFGGSAEIGKEIRQRTKAEVGLTCSVGVGYSMMSAKLASEEKKPNGYFEILTPEALNRLIIDRNVRTIYGVGIKTAEELKKAGITTVREILAAPERVTVMLGKHGVQIVELAQGIDRRKVTTDAEVKSIGTEQTFQKDITDFDFLKDYLLLTAERLSYDIAQKGLYANTITVKITYSDMKSITRSKSGDATRRAKDIYATAAELLKKVERRPIRLIGMSLSNFTDIPAMQMSLFDEARDPRHEKLDDALMKIRSKYGRDMIKPASVYSAEKRVWESEKSEKSAEQEEQK